MTQPLSPGVPILRRLADLRAQTRAWRAEGARIGVVPTMGALHEGHLSLVRAARAGADRVIVTIFVNPRQFNSREDYDKYPRTEEADARLLAPHGVDAVFVPDEADVYPPGYATTVSVAGVTAPLEGAHRPGHFDGMATVVTKLFTMTQADLAWFGEKDWQQLQVVRRLVADLNLPVTIIGCPTVREADGLALSSRNQRLDAGARARAAALPAALFALARSLRAGATAPDLALDQARAAIQAAGLGPIDYLELRDGETLGPLPAGNPAQALAGNPAQALAGARLFAAVWADGVRLIDNIALEADLPG